jgi:hypothetical protein
MEDHTWDENYWKIKSYWPTIEFTNKLRDFYKKHLMLRNQWHLSEAIDVVKMKYVTFGSNPPEMKYFLEEYDKVAKDRQLNVGAYTTPSNKYWVDFEKPSPHTGVMSRYSTDAPDFKTANEIALKTNGRVRNQRTIDNENFITDLNNTPREKVAEAVKGLRDDGYLSKEELPSDFALWKLTTQGKVMARIQNPKQKAIA